MYLTIQPIADNILSKMMTVVKTSDVQFCMKQQINKRDTDTSTYPGIPREGSVNSVI